MKRGFVLLETLIVISLVSIALVSLYGTFNSVITNNKKNVLYDDVANIYKVYYLKEYLDFNSLLDNQDIKIVSCSNFKNSSCNSLVNEFKINKIYITKYDLKSYNKDLYSSSFNNYLSILSNKDNYKYRLVVEFLNDDTYAYASLGLSGEDNE